MMRAPSRVATAVRDPEGRIRVKAYPFVSVTRRKKLLGLPVVRGAIGLFEALTIGVSSLNWAAETSGVEEEGQAHWYDPILGALMMVIAFAFAIGLFMAVPYFVAGLIPSAANQVHFHLVAGSLRILLLVGYMFALSFIPDIAEVFRYHGAEHKSIFTLEKDLDLSVGNSCAQSRFHPRCGTSFLLLAAVLTMLGFMLFDTLWTTYVGEFSGVLHRIAIHLPVIPLIAGLSYEFLRLVERHSEDKAWQPLVKPGFWLQRITTREPEEKHVEVALAALKEALREEDGEYDGYARDEEYSGDAVTAEAS